jgi:hypothetical protein
MYMREPEEGAAVRTDTASGEWLVLAVCAFAVLFLGILPNSGALPMVGPVPLLDWARESVRLLGAG